MYDITIVCTHHSEIGNCNSDDLYKIIESINPDVIFEELPQDLFDKVYAVDQFDNQLPPEIKTVKKYLLTHKIDHIPVDTGVNENSCNSETQHMFALFQRFAIYKNLQDQQKKLIIKNGYDFLNSKRCEELHMQQIIIERSLLPSLMKSQLYQAHESFYEELDSREHEIVKNIYNYSKQKQYNQGLLLIGSGHRKTIFEKIEIYKTQEDIKLNWLLYSPSYP
jgi:hypothetical protein